MRRLFVLMFAVGCGDSGTPPAPPLPLCSAAIPPGAAASQDATIKDASACTEAGGSIALAAGGDIVPAGFIALGPSVRFSGATAPFPHGVDFVVPADLAKGPKGAAATRIVVVEKRDSGAVVVTPVANVIYEAPYHRLHFHGDELGTYQAAIAERAGAKRSRHYTFRALGGVSMGGIGSSVNFFRHPDRYDGLAVMGADPGPDLTYILGFLNDYFFRGFCTVADEKAGRGKVGQLCAPTRKLLNDQREILFDFEHLATQAGEGVGLTLRRKLYVRAFRDLSRAFGNAAYPTASGKAGYLPPGVPASALQLDNATACSQPVVLKKFYDRDYNPDGSRDVITFCDGGDGDAKGNGVFDPSLPQGDPTQIILAVDVNGNGKRDSGEPVLIQGQERFRDVGTDGLADADEPGYDALKNPDPNHDDYHWLHNPGGTEGNWRYDAGEPYDDFGTDGVQGLGCEIGSAPGCYDFGEGNKKFDMAPSTANWYAHDPRALLEALPDDQLDRLAIYYDAGIRDFLNAHVSTNALVSALHQRGQPVRVWEGFPSLLGLAQSKEDRFEASRVDLATSLGRHAYVRYGDPDLDATTVQQTGDGRHVGTATQATHRAQMLFSFLSSVWPGGDYDQSAGVAPDPINASFTSNGRATPYTVVLPPGYDDAASAGKRYPVAYLMHGYGMAPMDLGVLGVIATSAMLSPKAPLQKFIIVIVDGRCRPGGEIGDMGPLPSTGDLCEEGTFFTDHPEGAYQGEQMLIDLQTKIDATYRTKAAADLEVTD